MKQSHIIAVGKLKDKHLESLETDYLKRIKRPKLIIHEVKANAENRDLEAANILKKIEAISNSPFIVVMTEFGKQMDSPKFSRWFYSKVEEDRDLFFVICGAEGPGKSLLERCQYKLSLSEFTFPHKIARLLLVEQLYRAQTIFEKHPYHN